MKLKRTIAAAIVLIPLVVICCRMMMPASLDFSKDEAPFRDIRMPPKLVRASSFMDAGSVVVEIVDQSDHHHSIYFPFDHDGILDALPTAYDNLPKESGMLPLKNPARAKSICIQLLKDHAVPQAGTVVNGDEFSRDSLNKLSNPPYAVAGRILCKIENFFH